MKKLLLIVPLLALAGILVAGTAIAKKSKKKMVRSFKIVNVEYKGTKVWIPGTLIVKKGEEVTITLVNKAPSGVHGYAIHDFGIMKEVANDGKPVTFTFTADKVGIHRIHCHKHPGHIGGQLLVLKK